MSLQSDQEVNNELSYYTLSHGDPSFIHQYIVDAFAAQHADENPKRRGNGRYLTCPHTEAISAFLMYCVPNPDLSGIAP